MQHLRLHLQQERERLAGSEQHGRAQEGPQLRTGPELLRAGGAETETEGYF